MYGQLGDSRYDIEVSEEENILHLTKHTSDKRIKKIKFIMKEDNFTEEKWREHWSTFEKCAANYYKKKNADLN